MKEKNYRIAVLWGGVAPHGNMGVLALTYSIIYILDEISKERGHIFEVDLYGFGIKKDCKLELDLLEKRINIKYVFAGRYSLNRFYRYFVDYKKLFSYDSILDLSAGDSFTDIYGKIRLRNQFTLKLFYLLFSKKYILLPQTIGPFLKKINKKTANLLLKRIDLVYTRDKLSSDYMQKNCSQNSYKQFIDLAFILPFEKETSVSENVEIGLNVSGLLYRGGYSKNNMFELKVIYPDLIDQIIENFHDRYNQVKIWLVGHVLSPLDKKIKDNVEDDYSANKILKGKYPFVEIAPKFDSPIAAKSFISNMDFFTGSRMHACIAAFSSCVPVVPIAYSRKFKGLFNETLDYHHVAEPQTENIDQIMEKLIYGFENRDELRNQIDNRMKDVKILLYNFKNDLADNLFVGK